MTLRDTPEACEHKNAERVARLYVDGRPLYQCISCDVQFVYEDDKPSDKALCPLSPVPPKEEKR